MGRFYDRLGNSYNDVLEWARAFEEDDRVIAQGRHKERGKNVMVSTVFLGLDHNFFGVGPPLLFETMAFEYKPKAWNDVVAELDYSGLSQRRYATEDEARAGHDPWQATKGYW